MSKIIIIEDNELVARLYETKLLKEGHVVGLAFDGAQGIELIRSNKPDLVVVDLMLPDISGIEIIKQLRDHTEFVDLPIIAYSADETLLLEAENLKATETISKKENSSKEILDHIRNLLEAIETWKQLEPDKTTTEIAVYAADGAGLLAAENKKQLERVLIVEDDLIIAALVKNMVEELGYTAVHASDGREAYKILATDANFAAGIFDVEMPHIKGTDLVTHMRTEKRLAAIPVMMMTADESVRVQVASFAGGASVFLPKPFTRAAVQTMFEMLIQTRRQNKTSFN